MDKLNSNTTFDVLDQLIQGSQYISDAVKVTMGPKGCNVIIKKPGVGAAPQITKDGITVAKWVKSSDPIEQMAIEVIRQAAAKTNDEAGDGTTTSTVLAYAMLLAGKQEIKSGTNPFAVKRMIEDHAKEILAKIKEFSSPLSEDEIRSIALVASNNDPVIADDVSEVMKKIGAGGEFKMDISQSADTKITFKEGYHWDRGYRAQNFVNTPDTGESILKDCLILISDQEITNFAGPLQDIFAYAAEQKKALVVIAKDIDGEALSGLAINQHVIPSCAVAAPAFKDKTMDVLMDICAITGATLISDEIGLTPKTMKPKHLGSAEMVITGKRNCQVISGGGNKKAIAERIETIKGFIKEEQNDFDREYLEKRLSKITGFTAIIKVGGKTDIEKIEKLTRYEDALRATKSGIQEGKIPCASWLLYKVATLRNGILRDALKYPYESVINNLTQKNEDTVRIIRECFDGNGNNFYNVGTGEMQMEPNVVDSHKVLRCAIENAVSVSSTLLTTTCAVLNED